MNVKVQDDRDHSLISKTTQATGHRRTSLALLILVCFFLSGMTALIYEIVWMRLISRIIGGAPFAVSTILVVFMGGLGIGSWLASRKADTIEHTRLIRIYGFLELGIGLYALCVPFLLWLIKWVYIASYDRFLEYTLFYNLLIFAGALAVLCIPAICMGATLPILCRFYVKSLDELGTHAGRLYGLNTIGGAAGSLICGFWLIALLGVYGSMLLAVFVNLAIGLFCIYAGRDRLRTNPRALAVRLRKVEPEQIPAADEVMLPKSQRIGVLVIFAVSGFCAMAYEVLWTKLLGLMIGPTTYSFTIVLVTFIVGLAVGNMVFGRWADRTRNAFRMLIITQFLAALFALLISQLMGQGQLFFAKLLYAFSDSFALQSLTKALLLFAFMMIPTFFLGACFPLVVKIFTRSLARVGNSIGVAYAVNTIGAVAGSFCAGFILIPFLGKEMSLSLVTGLQMVVSLGVGLMIWPVRDKMALASRGALALALCLGMALCFFFPSWNRLTLATGKYHRFEELRLIELVSNGPGWIKSLISGAQMLADIELGKLVYYGDGIGGFTTVLQYPGPFGDVEYSMANSGKMDASSRGDMKTQTLLAHFPMLFSQDAKNVMVLGLASGITAGEVLHYPIERLDVIDINDRVFEGAAFFNPWNNGVLVHPKTRLIVQDGMAHLTLSQSQYDVIISEPSNPWMAGMASLFTHDFFSLAKNRLTDNGIYVQWFHCYQMDWSTFALVGRTFADVFPHAILVTAEPAGLGRDYLFVGFKNAKGLDMEQARKNINHTQKSSNIRMAYPELFYRLIVAEDLKTLFGRGLINYDDRPHLEYAAPKLMYGGEAAQQEILRNLTAGRTLTAKTSRGFDQVVNDDQARVDYAEYALSVYSPFPGMVNDKKLSPSLRGRYAQAINAYCAHNLLDGDIVTDPAMLKSCRGIQIDAIEKNLKHAADPARSHYFLGRLFQDDGRPDLALSHYAESVRLKAMDADRFNDYGNLLSEQGRQNEARVQFAEALRLRPNFLLALGNMAFSYLKDGQLDQAAVYFRKTLVLRPDLAESHYNLGVIASKKNDDRQAITHLRDALQLNTDLPEGLGALALILVATRDPSLADPASALRYAERACLLTDYAEPVYLATYAAAQAAAGNFAAARKIAAQAMKLAKAKNDAVAMEIIEKYLK
jgi:spermidine synthase